MDVCRKLDTIFELEDVWKCAADSIVKFESIDTVCVFTRLLDSSEYILECSTGLPVTLMDICSSIKSDSALPFYELLECRNGCFPDPLKEISFSHENTAIPKIFPKGVFRIQLDDSIEYLIFAASFETARLSIENQWILETLLSVIITSVIRISSERRTGIITGRHSLLLDKIHDPVFVINRVLKIQYSNPAFRELIRFDSESIGEVDFESAAGPGLYELMKDAFSEILDSDASCTIVIDYHDRVFETFISGTPGGLLTIMRDITEFEQTRKKLDFREKFESLLINIATDFIEMQGSDLNLGIHDALLNIGVAIEVDRAYLFRFSDGMETMVNTHEWCASNIQPQIEIHHELSCADYPWWMNKLSTHQTILILSVMDLPSWAEAEKNLHESRNTQSLVSVPIVHGNDLIGFLGFDCVNRERIWSEDIIDLLRIVGDAIGNALERNRMEKTLLDMYRQAEKEAQINAVLLREVNHRVKNNLSEIIGLIYAQKRFAPESSDFDEFAKNLISRIRGLATVHDMLSSSGWDPLELTKLARRIVNSAIANASGSKKLKASISGSSVQVNAGQAHALALIFNELVRNSLKHALFGRDSLRIKIRMRRNRSDRITIIYSDNGPGYPGAVLNTGMKNLGLDLIQNLIIKNLQGKLTLLNDGGACAKIEFRRTITEDDAYENK